MHMDVSPEIPATDALPDTAAWPQPPTVTEPTVSVVLLDEPQKRRTGLFVGVGVLAVGAIAAAGFVIMKHDTAEATFSLTEASAAAAEVKAVAYTMTMGVMGEEITAEAETDTASGLSHVALDLGIVDGSMEMILDTNDKVIYLNSSFLVDSGLSVDTEWVKIDEEFLQQQAGSADVPFFDSANVGNPLDAGAMFETARSVTEIGFDEVDGVKVKHFEVVVDTAAAIKVSPQLQQQFDALDADIPKELTYDVYVDEQNQIRRTSIEMSLAGQKVSFDVVIKPLAGPIVIELPKPADVTDVADLM